MTPPRSRLIPVADLLETVHHLRKCLAHQEQLLELLLATVQLNGDPSSPATWEPEKNGELSRLLATPKFCKIGQPVGVPNLLIRIKKTWVGRLYINRLKQVSFLRGLIIWLWRNLYPVYINTTSTYFGSKAAKRWRPLINLKKYVEISHSPIVKVFDSAKVDTREPRVFPIEDQSYLATPHDHYIFPSVYITEISNATVYGGTNIVFVQDAAICHDLYDFDRDYTSEELHGRHVIDATKKRMRLLLQDAAPEKISVAATFVDACSSNYAHWLTEILPRIATFCSIEQFTNIPIIVDDGLHQNIMESLALVAGTERDIITVPLGRSINVDTLYVTSVTGYVPFERRDSRLTGHSHGIFSPSALNLLKECILPSAKELNTQSWPRKVYLRRTSGYRSVINEAEIEKTLSDRGYVIVIPENLSFLQQFALFNDAEKIVSATGAAIANSIFCKPSGHVCILISKHQNMAYWYWINMLSSIGICPDHVLGDISDDPSKGVHGNFYIGVNNLIANESLFQ